MKNPHYGIIEAETFSLDQNFIFTSNAGSSGTGYVQTAGSGLASMSTTVEGIPGTYDLVMYYWDENDGRASSTVKIDGEVVDSWVWNKNLGSANANPGTYTTRVIKNVTVDELATITVEGRRDGGEPLRIDKIELQPSGDRDLKPGLKAFDGAEGFGSDTAGGRGGWIVKVTNLNDSGEGSLRWALQDFDTPRIVVFEVGGLITLKDAIYVKGDVTVAGQTAPGDGVTIRGRKLQVVGDDVIIRGLKIRPGDGPGQDFTLRDAISVGTSSHASKNVVIDSNSFSWAGDETVTVWGGASNVTVSNNIIAEALDLKDTLAADGSFGMLIGADSHHVSVLRNLFSSNEFRNPTISSGYAIEVINNLVYNYAQHGLSVNTSKGDAITVNAIGNVFDKGTTTGIQKAVRINGLGDGTKVYLEDNFSPDRTSSTQPERDIAAGSLKAITTSLAFAPSDASAMAATAVRDHVLTNVGARANGLDATDARIINDVLTGRGGIITSQSEVGGYKAPTVRSTLADTDGDGIPDFYESLIGSDPTRFDPHGDVDRDGYSNIENYINGLISGAFGNPGGPAAPIFVEAEAFRAIRGFVVESSVNASGGAVLKGGTSGTAEARYGFTGGAGRYDIVVRYVDENDGVSTLALAVDGVVVDQWDWNAQLGSAIATPGAFTERLIDDVSLAPGQTVTLIGRGDAGEPLRVDSVSFTPRESTDASLAGAEENNQESADDGADQPFRIEAEALTLVSGFVVDSSKHASGGSLIKGGTAVEARAEISFAGATGLYDVTVRYVDETDGVSRLAVLRDDMVLDQWLWNAQLGSAIVTPGAFAERVITGVSLTTGQTIALTGMGDAGEPLRVDSLLFTPTATPSAPTGIRIEAESMSLLSGFSVSQHTIASNNMMIGAGPGDGLAHAQTLLNVAAGRYDLAIRHSDENDAVASLSVLLNGDVIDAWDWDQNLGGPLMSPSTLTDRIILGVDINPGDVLELRGSGVAQEPLRIDYVDLVPEGWV